MTFKKHDASLEKQIAIVLIFFVATLALMLWPAWQWAFMGLVAASICHPIIQRIRNLFRSKRPLAVSIFFGLFVLLALIPLLILLLTIDVKSLSDFETVKGLVLKGRELFDHAIVSITDAIDSFTHVNESAVRKASTDLLKSLSGIAGRGVTGVLGAGPALVTNLFIMLITFYYSLMSLRKLRMGVLRMPILDVEFKAKLIRSFSQNAYSSVVAAGGTAAVQAAILCLGMVSLGYNHWILGTALAFFAAFVPVVGTLPISVVVIIQFAIEGNVSGSVVMLVVAVIAGLSDNIIRPMFLKGAGDMHPWLAFVSVLGGLSIFGIWGLFIGPILVGMLKTAWNEWGAIRRGVPRPARLKS